MNKKLENVQWGEYRLGDLFVSSNGDFDIQKNHINGKGEYVITAGVKENGIMGKTDIAAKIFEENTITVDMFGYAFYRVFKYKMVTHARVFSLKAKFKLTEHTGIFIVSAFHFLNSKFGYENMCSWAKIKDEYIQLPTKNGEIDFEFMESFVAELEAQRVAELEAYLLATGLKDYELTDKEKQAVEDYENGRINLIELKVSDIFNVSSSKKRFDANKVDILTKGYPYVVRTSNNNGIKGYLNEDINYLNEGNTISFGQDTATMFYQENPYFTGDKIKILKSKFKNFNKYSAQYFIGTMSKSFSSFSWGASSFSEKAINKQGIFVKVKDNEIDFEYIETLISAIQKLVIRDVVIFADRRIEATKQVIDS
ncbi:restriction endonuclease subunit S [Clostridium perfringens]|uniref:restriction endonuclease subunit S n=1 Tax=Clostridium perfringens TaxID=1502 RepID=UPI0037540544